MVRARSPVADVPHPTWPAAAVEADIFRVEGQLCGGFELAPLNLELMADAEREATLDNLAALYDAIPGPFQLLSVPTDRTPAEHVAALKPAVDGQGRNAVRPYVATYHDRDSDPAAPTDDPLVDAATEAQLARTSDLIRRVAEERGLAAQAIDGAAIAAIWSAIARSGATYTIKPGSPRVRRSSPRSISAPLAG